MRRFMARCADRHWRSLVWASITSCWVIWQAANAAGPSSRSAAASSHAPITAASLSLPRESWIVAAALANFHACLPTAGAAGFIDVDAEPEEAANALRAVAGGGTWVPEDLARTALTQAADDLDVTADERRSRLNSGLIALIPIVGVLTAALSFLWRQYLGAIGVRPVDIAIDPASRVVDALIALSVILGVFGPLVFIRTWLDLLRRSPVNRGPIGWFLRRRALAWIVTAALLLTVIALLLAGTKVLIVVIIGPFVAVAMIARALDLDEVLPAVLRIKASAARTLLGGVAVLVLCLAALTVEVVAVGPQFGTKVPKG